MRWNLRILVLIVATVAILAAACSSNDPDSTPVPTTSGGGVSVFVPYIFSGNFTVAGEPGPRGVPMFAKLGDGRGLFNDTVRPGEYTNVSVAPEKAEAVGGEITFHLGPPDGPNVQAEETYVYAATTAPKLIELDLTFPRLP